MYITCYSDFFIYDFYLLKLFIETFQIYIIFPYILKLKLSNDYAYIKNFINTLIIKLS